MCADTDHIFFKASREKHVDVYVCVFFFKNILHFLLQTSR